MDDNVNDSLDKGPKREWFESDDPNEFRLSLKGIDAIREWCKFKCEMFELEYGDQEPDELDYDTQMAFLVAFAITELRAIRTELMGEVE